MLYNVENTHKIEQHMFEGLKRGNIKGFNH